MADSATWFHDFVERCRQRRSLPSVQAWVAAHAQPAPAAASNAIAKRTPRDVSPGVQYSARNDARTSAGVSGPGIDIGFPQGTGDYNIFADITLHDQAAATIACASQSKSAFNGTMSSEEGVALERFVAYLNDFIAPHWLVSYYKEQTVLHESTNHSKFVDDLVAILVEGLSAVGGDAEAAQKAEESVRCLSKRLSSSDSPEEKLTLFSSFWMERQNPTDPVFYGIFYTTLHARYEQNGKTEVISTSITTHSVIFNLISGVLIAHEEAYNNALLAKSVDDWLSAHEI